MKKLPNLIYKREEYVNRINPLMKNPDSFLNRDSLFYEYVVMTCLYKSLILISRG